MTHHILKRCAMGALGALLAMYGGVASAALSSFVETDLDSGTKTESWSGQGDAAVISISDEGPLMFADLTVGRPSDRLVLWRFNGGGASATAAGGWIDPIRVIGSGGQVRLSADVLVSLKGLGSSLSFQYFLLSEPVFGGIESVRQAWLAGDEDAGLPEESRLLSRQFTGSGSDHEMVTVHEDMWVPFERDHVYYLVGLYKGELVGESGPFEAYAGLEPSLTAHIDSTWHGGVVLRGPVALAVPEADAWALALCGLAVAGLSARVRQRRSSPAAAPAA